MASVTIKNLPAPIHARLRDRAVRNRRSLNAEIIACLEQVVMPAAVDTEALLRRARELRAHSRAELSPEDLRRARRTGRP